MKRSILPILACGGVQTKTGTKHTQQLQYVLWYKAQELKKKKEIPKYRTGIIWTT